MQQAGYPCQRQQEFHVLYKDVHIATFRTDVSLLPQLIIEIKVAPRIDPLHIAQTVTYLKVTEADLGIVVNFGGPSVEFERVPNFISQKRSELGPPPIPDDSDLLYPELTGEIRRCLYVVHGELGPGFWHPVYRDAAKVELEMSSLLCEHKLWMDIYHDGWHAGRQRCNVLVVDNRVMVTPVAFRTVTEGMRVQFKAHLGGWVSSLACWRTSTARAWRLRRSGLGDGPCAVSTCNGEVLITNLRINRMPAVI